MNDGTSLPIDAGEQGILRPLEALPPDLLQFTTGLDSELGALELLPRFQMNGLEEHSFREGLMQNAQILWTYRKELGNTLEDLLGRSVTEEDIKKLVRAAIVTDLGKVGPNPVKPGEIPQNLVARVYREFRWTQAHSDLAGEGRTTVPFGEAVKVMRELALEKYPADKDEIERIFSLDEAELKEFGFDANTPLAQVFTGLHLRANARLLSQLEIPIPERDYASGHHFPAGLELLPDSIVKDYELDGKRVPSSLLIDYVVNTAILAVTDRLQGFIQRSAMGIEKAQRVTSVSMMNDIVSHFSLHPYRGQIEGMYASVLAFVVNNRFAKYYVGPQN